MKLRSGLLQITVIAALFTALALTMPAGAAGTCYVNDDASGLNNGTDWANAYTSLQSALADSCTEIWVAAGTYKPDASNRMVSFALESGTAIYGGFDGTETILSQRDWKTNVTILSGDLNGDDIGFSNKGDNSYHVVSVTSVDATAVLDGFTISGGNADDNNNPPNDTGGGMLNANSSSPTLANLIFSGNFAFTQGGGMGNENSSNPTLTNITFANNATNPSNGYGGGLSVSVTSSPTLTDVSFTGNTALFGGGMNINNSTPVLMNVTFANNTANNGGGGGIYISQGSPTLTNVTFSGNTAGASAAGGGIFMNNNSNPVLTNVTFSDNSAPPGLGGGIFINNASSPTLKNVISANSTSGGDCVLFNGTNLNGASSNNLMEDGSCPAAVSGDPTLGPLADNGGATLTHLPAAGSAAIDAGIGCTATDQRGLSRPQNGTCDIGAVERDLVAPTVSTFTATSPSSLSITITAFTASDTIGVTGYKITESPTPPSADDSGWTASAPTSYTVSAGGSYTLYPWAKDRDGNVSTAFGPPASVDVDATPPTVNSFTATSPSTSLSIPITTFTASDGSGVTGYMITETATPPLGGDSGWTASAPSSYTVGDYGSYTLYPWAKDTVGNVSAVYGSPASVTACFPGNITVTSNADSGAGTLRKALADICAGHTIHFDSALSGATIRLNSTLDLLKNVTIDGSALASPVTLNGDSDGNGSGDVRVFYVANGVTATLNSLIVTKGWDNTNGGAGLLNDGTAIITNSVFSENTVDNQLGGAIFNKVTGTLTVTGSTFSGNAAYNGGAIGNYNQLSITNSTFSANTSVDAGGAIYTSDPLSTYTPSVTMTIANSTFSDNAGSFGGGVFSSRTQTLTNNTFSGNVSTGGGGGGAIWQDSETLNYANNILANSLAENDCYSQPVIGIDINNLVEVSDRCGGSLNVDPNLGSLADNGGPTQTFALLTGSPAIDAGSDAVCAASPVSNLDQRGVTRPNGAHCDIGAHEYVDTTAPTITAFTATSPATSLNIPITAFNASDDVTVTGYKITESSTPPTVGAAGWTGSAPTTYSVASVGSYTLYPWAKDATGHVSAVYGSPASVLVCLDPATVTNANDSGAGSLRQAIADACEGGTVDFDSSLSGSTIHLASTLNLDKDITIDGSSLISQITLSGDSDNNGTGDVRVFSVANNPLVNVTLDSLTITKGQATGTNLNDPNGEGGAILNWAYLTITNSTFLNNSATGTGGAINSNRPLIITNSTFSGNSSTGIGGGGGAIMNNSSMTISGSTFSGNTGYVSNSNGGAIFNTSVNTTITNSTFAGNAATAGGAILTTANLAITNSTISGNTATYSTFVSGLDIEGGTTDLSNTIIANSLFGIDCTNNATIGTNTNNLIEDSTCSPALSGDPKLGALANNGGPTQTFAMLAGSKAIDAGDDATCIAAPVSNLDQRGVARPNGGHCDIGAYEYVDTSAPSVTAFSATSHSNSLSIPITAFTASDDGILTGYLITTSSTSPSASASGWTASAPTIYTVVSDGSYTLYPWAKDAAGHVSAVFGSPASVTVDTVAPTAGSLVADNVTTSGGTAYMFTVTFSDNLEIDRTSLDGNDIRVSGLGGFTQLARLISVTPAGNGTPRTAIYQITAPGGAWDSTDSGTYTIAVEANQVFDTVGNAVGATSLGSFQVSLNDTLYLPLVQR